MKDIIYLDYNSTTPLDENVFQEMLPYLKDKFGNPSSKHHRYGIEAASAIKLARKRVADVINTEPDEIYFTSSATESINLLLRGIIEANYQKDINVITSSIEHKAVLETLKYFSGHGIEIRTVNPDRYGIINPEEVKKNIDKNTLLVSIMTANNEIGTIQPVIEISRICKEEKVLFHTDATQAYGKLYFNNEFIKADFISFSSHKIYGPKGAGALYIKKDYKKRINKQMTGGMQEMGMRGGTENVAAICGFGKASEIAKGRMNDDYQKQIILRDILTERILQNIPHTYLNGHRKKRLFNTSNICFEGIESGRLMSGLKDFALSTGSACNSATLEPSYVLKAIGLCDDKIKSSVRISIGRETTKEDTDKLYTQLLQLTKDLRN